jgi:hypothetical protein
MKMRAAIIGVLVVGTAALSNNLCILYASLNNSGFNLARVDFQQQLLTDLASLPNLGGAEGGLSAGADDGTFYIPNANIAYNYLLEVCTAHRSR